MAACVNVWICYFLLKFTHMLVIFPIFDIDVTLLYYLLMEIYSSLFDLFTFGVCLFDGA